MDTLNEYLNATPAEQDAEREKRGWSPRPTAAPTHRKPVILTAQMILANRERDRKRTLPPTHRGEPRPTLDELRTVNGNLARHA